MRYNKKAIGYGFIISIVTLVMSLLIFALAMPISLPFFELIKQNSENALATFIFLSIPFFLLISLIINAVTG